MLAYTKIQPWFMACNWDAELARLRILMADGPEALRAVDPLGRHQDVARARIYGSRGPPKAHRRTPDCIDRRQDVAALLEVLPRGGGSNNWVIAPSRTTTGRPILCNDPHLAAQLPAPWYLVSIRTPDWAVAGASFVGSPASRAATTGTPPGGSPPA